jgi:hypothetical protein
MPKESPAVQWAAELQQTGRLVLGIRRDKVAWVAFIALVGIVNGVNAVQELQAGTWSAYDYLRAAIALGAVYLVVSSLNTVRGGRSRVIVDDAGVSVGPGRLAWSEIERMEVADGKVVLYSGERKLAVSDLVLRHPKQFAVWLDTELRTRV